MFTLEAEIELIENVISLEPLNDPEPPQSSTSWIEHDVIAQF